MFAAVYFGILSKVHLWSLSSRRSFRRAILSELANSQPCIDKQSILLQTFHCKGWRDEINESIKNIKSDSLVIRYFTKKKTKQLAWKNALFSPCFWQFLTAFPFYCPSAISVSLTPCSQTPQYHWHRSVDTVESDSAVSLIPLSRTLRCHWNRGVLQYMTPGVRAVFWLVIL